MTEEFPRRDYQIYGLESFRKSVRELYNAAYSVEECLERMSKYKLDELLHEENEFWKKLRGLFLLPPPNGVESGITNSLFRIRNYAHELSLLIPRVEKEK